MRANDGSAKDLGNENREKWVDQRDVGRGVHRTW